MPFLNFNFVLLKNHLHYLKVNVFECFFKENNRSFSKKGFSQHIMMESLSLEKENIIKDIRNLFRLRKWLNYTGIKDIRNLFRPKNKLKQLEIEYWKILRIFLSMKKKKIIINQ